MLRDTLRFASAQIMQQQSIHSFFSRVPLNCPKSDDDVPLVPHGTKRHRARDGAVVNTADSASDEDDAGRRHHRFVGEAVESSGDYDDDECSDDSFVVPDHDSDSSLPSSDIVPVRSQLRSVCASLRNRRQCVRCLQCLRLFRVIERFMKDIKKTLNSDAD
jgi:hypothetical protein